MAHLSSYERTFTCLTQDSAVSYVEDHYVHCLQHVFGDYNEGLWPPGSLFDLCYILLWNMFMGIDYGSILHSEYELNKAFRI